MAEIEITLPTVQYGNVKLTASPEEFGLESAADAHALGVAAAVYLNLFSQGFKTGAAMDVSAPQGASQEAPPGNPQAAADRLAEGKPPRTVDESNEMAAQLIKNELGATEVDEDVTVTDVGDDLAKAEESDDAPWTKPTAAVKKPWEQPPTKAAPKLDSGW